MFSAFQSNAFQKNAYQIVSGGKPANNWLGGPMDDYWDRIKRYRQEQDEREKQLSDNKKLLEAKKLELERLQAEENARLEQEAEQLAIMQLMAEIAQIEAMNLLLYQQVQFFLQEEEDLLVILLSLT